MSNCAVFLCLGGSVSNCAVSQRLGGCVSNLSTCILVCVCVCVCVCCRMHRGRVRLLANACVMVRTCGPWLHGGVLDGSSLRSPAPTIPRSPDGHMARHRLSTHLLNCAVFLCLGGCVSNCAVFLCLGGCVSNCAVFLCLSVCVSNCAVFLCLGGCVSNCACSCV